jgi:hypothetical protein
VLKETKCLQVEDLTFGLGQPPVGCLLQLSPLCDGWSDAVQLDLEQKSRLLSCLRWAVKDPLRFSSR